jgi:DNA-binding transcriptional LysR family regulator
MSFFKIQCFLVAAEELSFTKAANRLFISQQAVSANIKKLEEHYNIKLFERRPTLTLTDAGEQMMFYARKILEIEKNMKNEFATLSTDSMGNVTLGISRLRSQVFFPQIWSKFHELYPNIKISLVENNSTELNKLLLQNKLDFYIGIEHQKNNSTIEYSLCLERPYCIISKSLLQEFCPENWENLISSYTKGVNLLQFMHLADFSYLLLPTNNIIRIQLEHFFNENNITPSIAIETNDQNNIFLMCKQDYGVGIVSSTYIFSILPTLEKQSDIFAFPIINESLTFTTKLIHMKDHPTPNYFKDFIYICKDIFTKFESQIIDT